MMQKNLPVMMAIGCFMAFSLISFAQRADSLNFDGYCINPWASGSIVAVGVVSNVIGQPRLNDRPPLSDATLQRVAASRVNSFDSWALRQDAGRRGEAHETSDIMLYSSLFLPAALFLDKEIRHDWAPVALLYLEAQSVNTMLYAWGPFGPTLVTRYRPAVYYEELPTEGRNFGGMRNSFYSGHVGSTATSTFFTARVLADYHPEWGGKRALLYGIAALPPALVGYFRIRALRHFPSDVLVGGLVGATVGILTPEIHTRCHGKVGFSAIYSRELKSLGLVCRL
ncbi:MAG: phosphatase PAP2 family protein [Phaeodactylibacter sp.]|nr:phosphatase PAP2 family protein [Phaeodactylibacter sp.]MCB9273227.1 phosphatase PAP2 family protein [Lewinellaceae bacterium]